MPVETLPAPILPADLPANHEPREDLRQALFAMLCTVPTGEYAPRAVLGTKLRELFPGITAQEFIAALQALHVAGTVEWAVADDGFPGFRLSVPVDPFADGDDLKPEPELPPLPPRPERIPDLGNPLADKNSLERCLRRIEAHIGRPIARTYRRGREAEWEEDQRRAGIPHVLADIPREQWQEWRADAKAWLIANGKGRSETAIDLQAAKMHRMETDRRVEKAVNVTNEEGE